MVHLRCDVWTLAANRLTKTVAMSLFAVINSISFVSAGAYKQPAFYPAKWG